MHHLSLTLNASPDGDHASGKDGSAELFKRLRPDNGIGDTRFIFERDEEDTLRRSRPLTDQSASLRASLKAGRKPSAWAI